MLTAVPSAYPDADDGELRLVPHGTVVERALAVDASRRLGIAGRYPALLALPDRWVSWVPFAIVRGLAAVRRYKPSVLWSTYPIASAHIIARGISGLTGIPWVADFRDPMVEMNSRTGILFPDAPNLRNVRLWVERCCVNQARALMYCTEGARRIAIDRYPEHVPAKSIVIPNGFEEHHFVRALRLVDTPPVGKNRPITLLHSGTVYLSADRDPMPLFDALARLSHTGQLPAGSLKIIFRAAGDTARLKAEAEARRITTIVRFEPPLPYEHALAEMLSVDGLLVLQGYTSNPAIPAKIYEYLRAGRPILALLDGDGETAALLQRLGVGRICSLERADDIASGLAAFLDDIYHKRSPVLPPGAAARFSREHTAGELARLFNRLTQDST